MEKNNTQMEYEFVHFKKLGSTTKAPSYSCNSNKTGEPIGVARYWPRSQQYIFHVYEDTAISANSLTAILDFVTKLNKKWAGAYKEEMDEQDAKKNGKG